MRKMPTISPFAMLCKRLPPPWPVLLRAGLILVAFAIVHELGWRERMSLASATSGGQTPWTLLPAALYGFFYVAAVLVTPILVLASGIYVVFDRLTGRPGSTS